MCPRPLSYCRSPCLKSVLVIFDLLKFVYGMFFNLGGWGNEFLVGGGGDFLVCLRGGYQIKI